MMRYVLLLLLCFPAFVSASDLEEGEVAFFKGDFAAASAAFRAVTQAHPRSADAWYNLGTSYAEAGRLGRAIHALEQSLLLDPDNEDAQHNLEEARRFAIKKALGSSGEARVVLPGEDDTGTGWASRFNASTLSLVFSFSWVCLFVGLAVLRQTKRSGLRAAATIGAVLFGLTALGAGGLFMAHRGAQDVQLAVVVASKVPARPGPGRQYNGSALVTAGVKVQVRGTDGDWRKVTLPDGSDGWMESKHLDALVR